MEKAESEENAMYLILVIVHFLLSALIFDCDQNEKIRNAAQRLQRE